MEERIEAEEQDEAYHDELMMPLMSILLDHLSDGWFLARLVALDQAGVDGVVMLKCAKMWMMMDD